MKAIVSKELEYDNCFVNRRQINYQLKYLGSSFVMNNGMGARGELEAGMFKELFNENGLVQQILLGVVLYTTL